jgi:hypothetical protein
MHSASVATIGFAARSDFIGKRYRSLSPHADGVWLPGDPDEAERFEEITIASDSDFRIIQTRPLETLEDRRVLRHALAELSPYERGVLFAGVFKQDEKTKTERVVDKILDVAFGKSKRRKDRFIDAPTHYLFMDCDSLDLRKIQADVDVFKDLEELPDMLRSVLEQSGLDWLIDDMLLHYSSSFGIKDRHTLRAHIEWRTHEPLTLAQQLQVMTYCNAKTTAAGFGAIFDGKVYGEGRYVFTRPAKVIRDVRDGDDMPVMRVVQPDKIAGYRVRLVGSGKRSIEVPGEAFTAPVRTVAGDPAHKPDWRGEKSDTRLQPGNVYAAVRARIYAIAKVTPEHRAEQAMRDLERQLVREIRALPDNSAEKFQERLKHVAPAEIKRSWDGALRKQSAWQVVPGGARKTAYGPEAVRTSLQLEVTRALKAAIESRTAAPDSWVKPRPVHTLFRVPPGVGKSHAALAAIAVEHLTRARISYLTPTVALSDELLQRKQRGVKDEYIRALTRHHKGREKLCKDEVYGAMAADMEAVGLSAVTTVCSRCPRKDACAWPQQHTDKASGLVLGQHAQSTTTHAKLRDDTDGAFDVAIIDESPLSTMLQERQPSRSLRALKSATQSTKMRAKDGTTRVQATSDLLAYRDAARRALESMRTPLLDAAAVRSFADPVTVRRGEITTVTTRGEDALEMELELQRAYKREVVEAVEAFDEARVAGRQADAKRARRTMQLASRQIATSAWFADLYRAINASLSAGRKHVFGIRINTTKMKGSDRRSTLVHIRTQLPRIYEQRPGLWLDGTANPEVWRAMFGRADVELVESPPLPIAPGPYTLTQYPERPFGKTSLLAAKGAKTDGFLVRLKRFIAAQAAKHTSVLVVAQAEVEAKLSEGAPPNIHFAHFNALKGLDKYRTVPCAIIIGRPSPNHAALEALTEALYYDDDTVKEIKTAGSEGLRTGKRRVQMMDGTDAVIDCEMHPDPRVEALRDQIVGAEVRQALHRLRLYDRTEATRACIYVFGQEALELPVHHLKRFVDADVSDAELLVAGGILTTNAEYLRALTGRSDLSAMSLERLAKQVKAQMTDLCTTTLKSLIDIIEGEKSIPYKRFEGTCAVECATRPVGWLELLVKRPGERAKPVFVNTAQHPDPLAAIRRFIPDAELGSRRR